LLLFTQDAVITDELRDAPMKIYFCLFFLFFLNIFAGEADTLKVSQIQIVHIDSIKVQGNDITENFIILRELTFKEGEKVNKKTLDYNRERVYSLGLFNYVDFYIIKNDINTILLIDVYEKWYLYPIPFIQFNDNKFGDATYGINFLLENFRGRNESLSAYLAFGYDPTYSLGYTNPALSYKSGISLSANLTYQDFSNKSYNAEILAGKDFEYNITMAGFSIGKRLDQFNEIAVHAGFRYIEAAGISLGQITASGKSIDRSPYLGVEYIHDTRDLKQFPKDGIFSMIKFTHNGFNNDKIAYNVFKLDFREYREIIKQLTMKWRLSYRKAFGATVPYYDYSYLGYGEYIRGHRENKQEGKQFLLGSVEMSYNLFKEWKFSLDLPLLPKKLTSARIGMNINIFTDTGTTFDEFNQLLFSEFYSGYVVGLNILFLPYNSLRIEYALNEYRAGEWIIATGFSF